MVMARSSSSSSQSTSYVTSKGAGGSSRSSATSPSGKTKISKEHPKLKVAGTYSPPFRQLSEEEDLEIVDMINAANPDLLFVALGCPKQEKWMYEHKDRIQACMLGVGQAFLVYAELEKRLPVWMRDLSLEWMYRIYQDPKRLLKRYTITNTVFLGLLIKAIFQRRNAGMAKEAERKMDGILF